ncbi:BTAD domain-containing putative transcriptional regulator [Kribbella albertanoniae]|uniref:AfsR/SARP family transcriptional regulator n=1 Tax=Kribbella albertanoniae TaxID=1266829 RepID=A0A4R4PJE5_9ACTN|nr:AfsR/SARP family transcriptional regulator [Kribbella albertanoniae]TDC22029.1 AfsR/SARP family transcriptional regulator [Kribbella albertanoniae]
MQFAVLGPLEVHVGAKQLTPSRAQARLLAVLLCRPNEWLRAEALTDLLWGAEDSNPTRLQVLVFRLRKSLDDAQRIEHRDGSYRIVVGPDELDVDRFLSLRQAGAAALNRDDLDEAAARLREAAGLWRGDAFAGMDEPALVAAEALRLRGERIAVLESLYAAEIRRGAAGEIIGELSELAAQYPLRESLSALLLRGLHQCGRRAEALTVYQQTRAQLIEELGLEPGEELRATQAMVLDDTDDQPAEQAAVRPRQLPPEPAGVAGRSEELARLTDLVHSHGTAAAPLVIAVDGPAGIGKTTFAVHAAHRVREYYGDGQIFIDLRGYSSGEPVDPATAVRSILLALGMRPAAIPEGLDERSAMLRSCLAGQRMLILLDNVRGAEQVRPLLPASDCLLLVTSRSQLRGLAVHDGAHRITLRPLVSEAAGDVLAGAVGRGRAAGDPEAVRRLVELCGRIPLALRIAGERASRFPGDGLAALATELSDEHRRLDQLADADDPTADLRAAFSWSYRALAAEDARMFRYLGLHPSGAIGLPAIAVLTGSTPREIRRSADRLVSQHLLEEPQPGRFKLHDLLRLYAAELAAEQESADEVSATTRRMLDWYLATAAAANNAVRPRGAATPVVDAAGPEAGPLQFAGPAQALHWFEIERPVLVELIQRAFDEGHDDHAWQFAWALTAFLAARQHLDDWRTVAAIGRRAAERSGRDRAVMYAGIVEGHMHLASSRLDESEACYRAALELAERIGDLTRQSTVLSNLGLVASDRGEHERALELQEKALAAQDGLPEHESAVLHTALNLSAAHGALGNFHEAIRYGELAVAHFRRHRSSTLVPLALANLAEGHLELGDPERARTYCREALALYDALDAKLGRANTLTVLGRAHQASGDPALAVEVWTEARDLFRESASPRAAEVDSLLATALAAANGS